MSDKPKKSAKKRTHAPKKKKSSTASDVTGISDISLLNGDDDVISETPTENGIGTPSSVDSSKKDTATSVLSVLQGASTKITNNTDKSNHASSTLKLLDKLRAGSTAIPTPDDGQGTHSPKIENGKHEGKEGGKTENQKAPDSKASSKGAVKNGGPTSKSRRNTVTGSHPKFDGEKGGKGRSRRTSSIETPKFSGGRQKELSMLLDKLSSQKEKRPSTAGSKTTPPPSSAPGNDGIEANAFGAPDAIAEEDETSQDSTSGVQDVRALKVLEGSLGDLPALPSRIVRIFTSSTFTDTTNERNALMENVYPKLKEYCRERHGLEFQVVDMRWGVRDEATDDHMTTELCMKEIENCQRLSMGPNFVVLLGQKYGYRPIPTIIPANELELMRDIVKDERVDIELLDKWFKKDENTVPPVYVLQPITTVYANFNNKRHPKLMETDQNMWWETLGKLQVIIRKAAHALALFNKLSPDQKHNYFMSVTEREVRRGIIDAKDTKEHCLAYIREITGINLQALRFCRNFIDMSGRGIDNDAQKFLGVLRDQKLVAAMPPANFGRFSIEWSGKEGIDVESHKEYLETFCDHFHDSIIDLIDAAVEKSQRLSSDAVYSEVLQHLHACNNSCKIFQGREDVVDKIKQYLTGESPEPFVLWGYSGCGKTSLLAKGYSQTAEWTTAGKKGVAPVCVLRFLGTSPDSSSIIPLLTSLCKQIALNYECDLSEIPEELSPLVTHFKTLLTKATAEKPLIVFLDSLDQLSGTNGAHQLAWLPVTLPPHCKIVVSTLPEYYGILDKLKKMIQTPTNYLQVTPLGQNLGRMILEKWLEKGKKGVTAAQWEVVDAALAKCNFPLFVKLVFDEICRWRSYHKLNMTTLSFNIHDIINTLYQRIENQHGAILVKHALGYVTAAKGGLSEAELEDLLSLDERVLNDVYQYHLPPVRRIPPLLWTRIRNDLPNYFSEREADGINVIGWYHRQFIEVSRERYFRNLSFVEGLHSALVEYYLGMWGGGRAKPFLYSSLLKDRLGIVDTGGEADRKVPEQPLYFKGDQGRIARFNLRKLSELPYHLVRSKRIDDLYNEVLFNFRFLHAKMSAMPLQAVIADFEDALEATYNNDVKLLGDALRLSASTLSHHPDMLGPMIVGRLLPYYNSHDKIQHLIRQCDTDGLEVNALVPCYHCMHTPGGPLQYSLEGHPFAPYGIAITSDTKYLVSVSSVFIIWEMASGDIFRQIDPKTPGIMQSLEITPNDKMAICAKNDSVVICNILTGDVKVLDKPVDGAEAIKGITGSNTHCIVWTAQKWYLYTLEGGLVCKGTAEGDEKQTMSIIHAFIERDDHDKQYLVWKTTQAIEGVESDDDMILEIHNSTMEDFNFHKAIAISKDLNTIYTCIAISENAVACYKKVEGKTKWDYTKTFENTDAIFTLTLSPDQIYLVATVSFGYKLWDLRTDKMLELKLPVGVRNIPNKNPLIHGIVFTRNNEFVAAGLRENLHVWDVKAGNLVKTLDAHFGRILSLASVFSKEVNKIVSSSYDKTIKIWNFENILEAVFHIDRNEKAIEAISLAANAYIGVTTTRNCVGVWNLENGKLLKTLANSARGSIVTHSAITGDGKYVVSAESGNVLFWDVDKAKCVRIDPQKDVQQMVLTEDDNRVVVISKAADDKGMVVCRTVPSGDVVYQFEYEMGKEMRTFKPSAITTDGMYLVVPCLHKSGEGETLGVYHAKIGTHMHNTTPKYPDIKEFTNVVPMPNERGENTQVALIDSEKGNIWDVKKKSFVKSVMKWNGVCTSTGRFGLYAPRRGGLELLDLKTGKLKHTLIPRIAEGVFTNLTLFTKNDQHVIYYHSGHRSIRVFRVSDGQQIADYKSQADINAISSTRGGTSIVLGGADGSVVVLTVADPKNKYNKEFLEQLPSRQSNFQGQVTGNSVALKPEAEGGSPKKRTFTTLVTVARVVAKSRNVQKNSKACVIQ